MRSGRCSIWATWRLASSLAPSTSTCHGAGFTPGVQGKVRVAWSEDVDGTGVPSTPSPEVPPLWVHSIIHSLCLDCRCCDCRVEKSQRESGHLLVCSSGTCCLLGSKPRAFFAPKTAHLISLPNCGNNLNFFILCTLTYIWHSATNRDCLLTIDILVLKRRVCG